MAQFKVGGKVVVIEDATFGSDQNIETTFSIRKGDTHTIGAIKDCVCGSVVIDIGFVRKKIPGFIQNHKCSRCERKVETLTVWMNTKYFVPLEETEFRAVTYTKILEEIPQAAN